MLNRLPRFGSVVEIEAFRFAKIQIAHEYTLDDSGRIIRAPKPEQGPKPKAEALDFEAHTGDKSAQRIAQERGHSIMQNTASWAELHRKLGEVGLRFEKKGSGAIIFVGEIAVKASSVDRVFSMGKLRKRLGEFEPGEYEDGRIEPIAPEPVSPAHLEDWKEYRADLEKVPTLVIQPDPQPRGRGRGYPALRPGTA